MALLLARRLAIYRSAGSKPAGRFLSFPYAPISSSWAGVNALADGVMKS